MSAAIIDHGGLLSQFRVEKHRRSTQQQQQKTTNSASSSRFGQAFDLLQVKATTPTQLQRALALTPATGPSSTLHAATNPSTN